MGRRAIGGTPSLGGNTSPRMQRTRGKYLDFIGSDGTLGNLNPWNGGMVTEGCDGVVEAGNVTVLMNHAILEPGRGRRNGMSASIMV